MNKASSLALRILQHSKKVKCTTIIKGRLWWIRTESHKIPSDQINEISSSWVRKTSQRRNHFNRGLKDAFSWSDGIRGTGMVWQDWYIPDRKMAREKASRWANAEHLRVTGSTWTGYNTNCLRRSDGSQEWTTLFMLNDFAKEFGVGYDSIGKREFLSRRVSIRTWFV